MSERRRPDVPRPPRVAARTPAVVGLVVAGLVVPGCASEPPASSAELPDDVPAVTADPVVAVDDNLYDPDPIAVEVGTEVTWAWQGRVGHDVVGDGFDSSVKLEGTFAHAFDEPGTYPYVCTLHPGMEGTVLVVEPQ